MKPFASPPRIVIDTNLVLSALVFSHGRVTPLRQAWQKQRILPLISPATTTELILVLAYPKFKLTPTEQQELIADYLPYCITVHIPNPPPITPICRDANDVQFLQLAIVGKADLLVTGDHDLLSLAGKFFCPILTAEQLIKKLTNLQ